MAYQKKYYFSFYSFTGELNLVELWQDSTEIITAEEVQGLYNPFSIEMPAVTKFEAVRGTGCDIKINCKSNMKFLNNLYHINPREFKIYHYIDGSLNWVGYMNSELFRESYSDFKDYNAEFTGNDGFSLMERFHFIQDGAIPYSGMKNQFDIIRIIFDKIGLPFQELKVCLSTIFTGQTSIASNTIFHETYIDCANFYNEDGEPETLRTVLEAILKPYGAFTLQQSGNIIITDIHNLALNDSFTFKRYSMSTWTYLGAETVTNNKKEIADIGYASTGQEIEISGGKNKQVVVYSPYVAKDLLDFSKSDFSIISNYNTYGASPYQYTEYTYNNSDTWTASNFGSFASYVGLQEANLNKTDSYLKVSNFTGYGAIPENLNFKTKIDLPYIVSSSNYLRINCKLFVNTVDELDGKTITDLVYLVRLRCRLKIGDKQLYHNWETVSGYDEKGVYFENYNLVNEWVDLSDTRCVNLEFYESAIVKNSSIYQPKKQKLDNRWIDLNLTTLYGSQEDLQVKYLPVLIPLTGFTGGTVSFEIYDFDILNYSGASVEDKVKSIRLKDIQLTIVDSNGEELNDSDVEYIGYLDNNFKDEAEKVVLLCGTQSTAMDRAKLLYFDSIYRPITSWTRWNQTYKIEELLLGSLSSNYRAGFFTLNNVTLNNVIKPTNIIQDSPYLNDRVFMITAYTVNFEESTINTTLTEVSSDTLIIQK